MEGARAVVGRKCSRAVYGVRILQIRLINPTRPEPDIGQGPQWRGKSGGQFYHHTCYHGSEKREEYVVRLWRPNCRCTSASPRRCQRRRFAILPAAGDGLLPRPVIATAAELWWAGRGVPPSGRKRRNKPRPRQPRLVPKTLSVFGESKGSRALSLSQSLNVQVAMFSSWTVCLEFAGIGCSSEKQRHAFQRGTLFVF